MVPVVSVCGDYYLIVVRFFFPVSGEVGAPAFDVFVILVFVLKAHEQIVAGPVADHEGVYSGRFEAGESFDQRSVETVGDKFLLFEGYELGPEVFHSFCLAHGEQQVEVEAYASHTTGGDIIAAKIEYFPVFLSEFGRILVVSFFVDLYGREELDIDVQTDIKRMIAGDVCDGEFHGCLALVGEAEGVVWAHDDPVVSEGVGDGAAAGGAFDADAGHAVAFGAFVNGTTDLAVLRLCRRSDCKKDSY